MMNNDTRDRLQRARNLAPAPRFDLGSTQRRGERRAAVRKIGIATFALMIGAAGLAGTVLALGHPTASHPGAPTPAPALGPGEFLYRETSKFWVDTCDVGGDNQGCSLGTRDDIRAAVMAADFDALRVPAIEPLVSRLWWSRSEGVRLWERSQELEFFRSGDRSRFVDLYGIDTVLALPAEDRSFGPGEFDPPDYTFPGWSRDPAVLADQLREAASPDAASPVPVVSPGVGQDASTGGEVRLLEEMLPVATPDFQQPLFEAAQSIEGMDVLHDTVDPAGRRAIALRITTEGAVRSWFFDPTTHLVLGGTWGSPGFARETWYVSELAIVNATDERPTAAESLVPPAVDPLPSFVDPRTL